MKFFEAILRKRMLGVEGRFVADRVLRIKRVYVVLLLCPVYAGVRIAVAQVMVIACAAEVELVLHRARQ